MTSAVAGKRSFQSISLDDTDIEQAERLLGLRFDTPRREILKCQESVDVQACPGSGKTTLLVAKLALLAAKWPSSKQGLCVLSHTNVARIEIERKLFNTTVGSRLLSYPHFIGTIHGFINEHIAIPWLKSSGRHIEHIDNHICADRCKNLLYTDKSYSSARYYLENQDRHSPDQTIRSLCWRWDAPELRLSASARKEGKLPCGEGAATYKQLLDIKRRVSEAGYYMHDDMFAYAEQAIAQNPVLINFIRNRFPVVFLDEMQDTNGKQIEFLHQIFPTTACSLRQRFGDSNQAIYEDRSFETLDEESEAPESPDRFPHPDQSNRRDLPNSLRFSQWIADRAAPIAPYPQTLVGCDIDTSNITSLFHTIFVFNPDHAEQVLPAYGKVLLDTFPDAILLNGDFRVLGRVQVSNSNERFKPRALPDYWHPYQRATGSTNIPLRTLADHVALAQTHRKATGECGTAIDLVIKGILRLLAHAGIEVRSWKPSPQSVLRERLSSDQAIFLTYKKLAWKWCVACEELTEDAWKHDVAQLVELLKGAQFAINQGLSSITTFLKWGLNSTFASLVQKDKQGIASNIFRYSQAEKVVDIKLSSIHAAKGETHTATLILETYYNGLDLEAALPWFLGQQRGGKIVAPKKRGGLSEKPVGKRLLERLKLLYVAMTRPAHLLCLAMRRSSLGVDENSINSSLATLSGLGWRVINIG